MKVKVNYSLAIDAISGSDYWFASCSKQVQKVRQELLAGMSIVKASGNKKQVAGPGLILWREELLMGKYRMM
jgi:hypothetical protein